MPGSERACFRKAFLQAEVGTATAMAAAGLMAVLNGTPQQAVLLKDWS